MNKTEKCKELSEILIISNGLTSNKHQALVTRELNKLIKADERYIYSAIALVSFEINLWCVKANKEILDKTKKEFFFNEKTDSFFSAIGEDMSYLSSDFSKRNTCMNDTEKMMKITKNTILKMEDDDEKNILLLLHTTFPVKDEAKYNKKYIEKEYANAVISFDKLCQKELEEMFKKIYKASFNNEEEEMLYHNTIMLFDKYVQIQNSHNYGNIKEKTNDFNYMDYFINQNKYSKIYEIIAITKYLSLTKQCLSEIKNFPKDGEKYNKISQIMISNEKIGTKNEKIAALCGYKQMSDVHKTKKRFFKILSMLLWGNSTKEIINMVAKKQKPCNL